MMGVGFELCKLAAERGLEMPLFILSFIVLIILTVIAANFENKPCFTSLCRSCKYEKGRQECDSFFCSLYKPRLLIMCRRRSPCPVEELINKVKQEKSCTNSYVTFDKHGTVSSMKTRF